MDLLLVSHIFVIHNYIMYRTYLFMARIFISEEAEIAKTTLEPSPIHHSLGMATCRESEPGFPAPDTQRRM